MGPVITDLRLATTPAQLAKQVSAISPTNGVLVDATPNEVPRGARGVANATAIRLAGAAERLARADGGRVERVHTVLVFSGIWSRAEVHHSRVFA